MSLLETVEYLNISCGWELYLVNLATTSASPQHIEESNTKYLVSCGLERRVPTYNYGTLAMIEIALSNISQYSCSCNRPAVFTLQFKGFKKCLIC